MDKASEDRKKILSILGDRFLRSRLSERKNPDGSLTYQDFISRMDKKQNDIPHRHFLKPKNIGG